MLKLFHIALAFDLHEKFSIVLIKNILNLSTKSKLHFHIFLSDITDFSFQESQLKNWGVTYSVYKIDINLIDDIQINNKIYPWITNAAFYRLLIPEMLPDYIVWFLYLDTDIYVNFDILELSEFIEETSTVIVASNGKGFNSGVMLINRKKFKETLPFEKSRRLIFENNYSGDNEFLIDYFDTLNNYIGLEFNYPIFFHVTSSEYLGVFLNYPFRFLIKKNKNLFLNTNLMSVKLIHFAGPYKPWNYNNVLPYAVKWRSIYYDVYSEWPWDEVSIFDILSRITVHLNFVRLKFYNTLLVTLKTLNFYNTLRKIKLLFRNFCN